MAFSEEIFRRLIDHWQWGVGILLVLLGVSLLCTYIERQSKRNRKE